MSSELTEAQRTLVTDHLPLAKFAVKRFARIAGYQDDYLSVAYEGLLAAAQRFDTSHKVQFNTYAVHCINSKLRDHVRRVLCCNGWRRVQPTMANPTGRGMERVGHVVSLEALQQAQDDEDGAQTVVAVAPPDNMEADLVRRQQWDWMLAHAQNDRERTILAMTRQGMAQPIIGKALGISVSRVSGLSLIMAKRLRDEVVAMEVK